MMIFKMIIIAVLAYLLFTLIASPFFSHWAKYRNVFIFSSPTGYKDFIATWKLPTHIFLKLIEGKEYLIYLCLLILVFLTILWITIVYKAFKKRENPSLFDIICLIILCIAPYILMIDTFISFLIFTKPIFGFRILITLLSLILFIILGSLWVTRKHGRFLRYFIIIPVLYFMVMSYNYANLQRNQ